MANQSNDTPKPGEPHNGRNGVANETELQDHERVDAMMPWIKRGELDGADRDLISDELARSPAFQAKLAQEGDLIAALDAIAADESMESVEDADAAWAKFKTRLSEESSPAVADTPQQPQPLPRSRSIGSARTSAWRRLRMPQTSLGWLATAQTAALAALALVFIPGQINPQEDEYRLLSSDGSAAQAPMGNLVVMFDPASDQATMQSILAEAGARIVDGPMENGGDLLSMEPDNLEAGLASLRASEAVALAQPLAAQEVQ